MPAAPAVPAILPVVLAAARPSDRSPSDTVACGATSATPLATATLLLRLRHRVRLVLQMMRQQRSQERRQVVLCCLVVVARRRPVVLRARVLVVRVDRLSRRVLLLVWWCLVVVDQHRRRVQRLQMRHDLEVAAIVRCKRQQGKRPARL